MFFQFNHVRLPAVIGNDLVKLVMLEIKQREPLSNYDIEQTKAEVEERVSNLIN